MNYHFYPRSKPPISTSVELFKQGNLPQSVSQSHAGQHKLPASIELFLFCWFVCLSSSERLGNGDEGGLERGSKWLLFLKFEERWISKNGVWVREFCTAQAIYFCHLSTTEDGQAAWHFSGKYATSCRCKKNENRIFCLEHHGSPKVSQNENWFQFSCITPTCLISGFHDTCHRPVLFLHGFVFCFGKLHFWLAFSFHLPGSPFHLIYETHNFSNIL